jgi:hypothetical protein
LDFDLENTLYFFSAGRSEYENKGADLFIEALARLNHQMKARKENLSNKIDSCGILKYLKEIGLYYKL